MGQTTIPDQMTAVAVKDGKGPAEALHVVETPTPAPGPGQCDWGWPWGPALALGATPRSDSLIRYACTVGCSLSSSAVLRIDEI